MADTKEKLNHVANDYQKQIRKPNKSPLDKPATQEEYKKVEDYYKQKPGSLSEKIRKIFE